MDKRAWVVSVNMGYGHQRTAFLLKDLAFDGKIINANDYSGIPAKDRKIWLVSQRFYEAISRFQRIPLIGPFFFSIYDHFQEIFSFYPRKEFSRPNFQLKQIYSLLKKGWGKDLINQLKDNPLPLITTFFIPAFMAEFFKYPGDIFCLVCDADVARTWAPLDPKESKIKYFVPTERAQERLKLYGIKPENIFLTGYPLPAFFEDDLKQRLLNLDPKRRYFEKYKILIEEKLGKLPEIADHPLTILFSVGGAGAQKEIAIKIIKCLTKCLTWNVKQGGIKIILSAGVKEKIKKYFEENIKRMDLKGNPNIEIIFEKEIENYFQKFNQALRRTDILWTKPSELSFYAALGLPIIIAPPIGYQEKFNMRWLLKSGFGIVQEGPNYANQWLFDWLEQGYLAEAATQGFIEGEKLGTLNIQKIVCGF